MATKSELLKAIEVCMDIADYAISRARAQCAGSVVEDGLGGIYDALRSLTDQCEDVRRLAVETRLVDEELS